MALERRKCSTGPAAPVAGPMIIGGVLAVLTVAGLVVAVDRPPGALLLTAESILGTVMLLMSLAGLFGCAAFATSLSQNREEPRGGSGRAMPVRVAAARRCVRGPRT